MSEFPALLSWNYLLQQSMWELPCCEQILYKSFTHFLFCEVSEASFWTYFAIASHISSYSMLLTILATSHLQKKYSAVFSAWLLSYARSCHHNQWSAPLSASIVIVISLLDCLWRYRQAPGKQAPGWIISCSSMPDGHIAVTWRGNGKWHHYHSNTGTTFGVRAGFQRICHTTSHLPTGKTIMLTSLAIHSMDNYFIWNGIILVIFITISCGVLESILSCIICCANQRGPKNCGIINLP